MACDLAIQMVPDKMAIFNRQLMKNLVALRPSAQLAIPIIELIGDSADVNEFYEFFQVLLLNIIFSFRRINLKVSLMF